MPFLLVYSDLTFHNLMDPLPGNTELVGNLLQRHPLLTGAPI